MKMGNLGFEIFDDDIAFDVQTTFEDYINEGLSAADAADRVLEEFDDAVEDEDDGPVIFLALAMLQVEEGEVQDSIREKALDVIESGTILERWEEVEPDDLLERKKLLKQLRSKLLK